MKWNMVFGALVVSVGLCSQSFGFELLDRMLGLNDCGCNSCCEKAPSCGCDKGCEPACAAAPSCAAEPSCCAAEPSCCAAPSCCKSKCKRHCHVLGHLHDKLFGCGCKSSCNSCNSCASAPSCGCAAEPSCGCAPACNSCCKKHRCGHHLLAFLECKMSHFKRACCSTCDSCNSGCAAEPSCGCGGGGATSAAPADDAAPMPPAPTADPSASLKGRRVLSASSKVVRRN
jgi:hypothetical protein